MTGTLRPTKLAAAFLAALLAGVCACAAAQDAPPPYPVPSSTETQPQTPAAGPQPREADVPDPRPLLPSFPSLSSGKVEITWNDLQRLLEFAAQQAAAQPAERVPAPIPWSVTDLRYEATADARGAVEIAANARLHIWQEDDWQLIPLFDQEIALASFEVDGAAATLAPDENGHWCLPIQGAGDYALTWKFAVPSTVEGGASRFRFTGPRATPTSLALRVPVKDATIASPQASAVTVTETADGVIAALAVRPSDAFEVRWARPVPKPEGAPAVAEVKPHVVCAVHHTHNVSETHTFSTARLAYQVLKGEAERFRFSLPDSATILSVEADEAVWNRTEGEGAQIVDVQGNHPWSGAHEVVVTYESAHATDEDDGGLSARLAWVRALDVARQTGHAAICPQGNVELTPTSARAVTRIDPAELPAAARVAAGLPVLMAFRYADATPEIVLAVRRLQDVPVRPAIIDRAQFATVLTEHGTTFTRATYLVRNNAQQFLRVRLPDGAVVESAAVMGRPVKPAREDDSDAVLIPLATPGAEGGVVTAELVYSCELPPAEGLTATVDLTAPAVDLGVQSVQWEVYLPERRSLLRATGDLEPVLVPHTGRAPLGYAVTDVHRTSVPRLSEGVERFLITDINNPAAAAHLGQGDKYSGPPAPLAAPGAVAGILPTRVDLPAPGTPIRFARMFLAQEEAPTLSLTLYDNRIDIASRWGLLLAMAVCAGALGATALSCAKARRLHVAPFLAAIAAAILAFGAMRWTEAGWSSLTALLLIGLGLGLLTGLRPRRPAPADAPTAEPEE